MGSQQVRSPGDELDRPVVSANPERAVAIGLGAVLLVGALLRVAGLSFRLPELHHPDEGAILNQALRFGTAVMHGQLGGKITLHGLVLLAVCLTFFIGLRVTGRVGSFSGFETYFFTHGSQFLLLGRMVSVLTSTATIWATYRLGREILNPRLGLVAALLVAVSPVAVAEAHYLKLDSSVCLLIILTLSELVRQLRSPTRHGWLRIGLAMGLACATHVNGLALLPLPLLVFVLQRGRVGTRLDVRRLVACYAVAVACFFVLTFRLVSLFAHADGAPAEKYHLEALVNILHGQSNWLVTFGHSISAYARFFVPRLLGNAALALAALGLVLAVLGKELRSQRWLLLPVLSFGLLYFLSLLPFSVRAERYALPLLPVEAILAALAIHFVLVRKGNRPAVAAAILLLATVQPAYGAIRTAFEFSAVRDTRDIARAWVESNLPGGTRLAIEAFHRLPTFTLQVEEDRRESRYKLDRTLALNIGTGKVRSAKLSQPSYPWPNYPVTDLTMDEMLFPEYENPYDLAALRKQGVEYVVLSSEIESLYDPPAERFSKAQVVSDMFDMAATAGEGRARFVDELRRSAAPIVTFGPARPWRLRGPILSIFQLGPRREPQ